MSYENGILSITDPKGRYMGMQDIASGYLTGRCIDITIQGPKDNPTAVVVTVYAEEDKRKNLKDIKIFSMMKADYNKNAIPKMFSILVNNACKSFDINKKYDRGKVYQLYSNGFYKDISYEEFSDETVTDFRLMK